MDWVLDILNFLSPRAQLIALRIIFVLAACLTFWIILQHV